MILNRRRFAHGSWMRAAALIALWLLTPCEDARGEDLLSPTDAARQIDLLLAEHDPALAASIRRTDDATFLRRVRLKLTHELPGTDELMLFALDTLPDKRERWVDRILSSSEAAAAWARSWRDVVFSRSQDPRARFAAPVFEAWLSAQFASEAGWDEVASAMITATGDVRRNGATALFLAQSAEATEVASETARIFLGVQLRCAECHDHPYDQWRRQQFHELAAFFPRVRIERKRSAIERTFEVVPFDREGGLAIALLDDPIDFFRRHDANSDEILDRRELPPQLRPRLGRLLRLADANGDGRLALTEVQNARLPRGRRFAEHFMPDLENPEALGTLMQPKFFLTGAQLEPGAPDSERRQALADHITARENPWFAKAFVNRTWAYMVGVGFGSPVDDLGPTRPTQAAEAWEFVAEQFRVSGHDPSWLLATIAATQAFQAHSLEARDVDAATDAALSPGRFQITRLTAHELIGAVEDAFGRQLSELASLGQRRRAPQRRALAAREVFEQTFGFDPSMPMDEVNSTVPQSLLLLNSPLVEKAVQLVVAETLEAAAVDLAELSANDDEASPPGGFSVAVSDLYMRALARGPSAREEQVVVGYLNGSDDVQEALEDLFWSLLNSTEFLHHR